MTLVAAAAVLSISMGLRQSFGLFLDPMVRGAGVSVAAFGLAMAMQNLAWGVFQPVVGALADKHGGRPVVMLSAAAFAAGVLAMSTGTTLGLQLGGGVLLGLAVAGTSHGVLLGVVSRLATPAARPVAVSILAAAGSLGTFVMAPAAQASLEAVDWRPTLLVFAAIAASMALFAIALKPHRSAPGAARGPGPDARAAVRRALAHPGYVAMTVAFFACGFQLIFIATHLPNYLSLCGLPPSVGAHALALIGIFNAFGTLLIGHLGERYGNRLVLALIYVARTVAIGTFVAFPATVETTLLFAAVMGMLWLSVIPPVSGLLNGMFGPTDFGVLFGVMFLSHQLGAFLGAWLGGLAFEMSGGYGVAWAGLLVIGALAAVIQLLMDDRPRIPASSVA